jgi:cystathionine beta-lyase/cystathionine gamma-synthase
MPTPKNLGFTTRAIHAGEEADPLTGAHGVPIYQNSTFALGTMERFQEFWDGVPNAWGYTRDGNPTVDHLERKVADLEGAESTVASASGMGAIAATLLTVGANSGHVVMAQQIYNTANKLVNEDLPQYGVSFSRVDITDLDAVEAAITPQTTAIYTEVFSNPGLTVADVPALAEIAHRHGLKLIIDNTFLSPALYRPLEDGADLVIHSATKYLAGHGEVLGGVVSGSKEAIGPIRTKMLRLGSTLSPFAAWLIMTGMRTLPLRMERHSHNGRAVATFLAAHPAVATWHYPGLPDDPGHATAAKLLGERGKFGGMVTISLNGGAESIAPFVEELKVITLATSLGDTASLAWPILGTDLVRLSIGLEDEADLLADLDNALERIPG